jgi:hypothetical protein
MMRGGHGRFGQREVAILASLITVTEEVLSILIAVLAQPPPFPALPFPIDCLGQSVVCHSKYFVLIVERLAESDAKTPRDHILASFLQLSGVHM